MHARHLEELFAIGITMIRVDAAIYEKVEDLAAILNRLPWDYVYQEWWGEYPDAERTRLVGHYRDIKYKWKISNSLANVGATELPGLLQVTGGVFGVDPDKAIYPLTFND